MSTRENIRLIARTPSGLIQARSGSALFAKALKRFSMR